MTANRYPKHLRVFAEVIRDYRGMLTWASVLLIGDTKRAESARLTVQNLAYEVLKQAPFSAGQPRPATVRVGQWRSK